MTPTDVLNYYKTQTATARALGISQASVAKWFQTDSVPALRQLQIQAITGLKADAAILPKKAKPLTRSNG